MGSSRRLPLCLLFGVVVGMSTVAGVVLATGPRVSPTTVPSADTTADRPLETDMVACAGASLEERAAQTLVVGLPAVVTADDPLVEEVLDVGVGGVFLTQDNVETTWQVRGLIAALRRGSAHGLLVATDEEPGRVASFRTLLGATSSARTLARRGEPEDVRAFAQELGGQLAAMGVDADFAPVVDIDSGPARGVIGDRSFSGDPATAAEYGLAFSRGLASAGVHPTAKHFPGHGRTRADTHRDFAVVEASIHDLRASDLVPFAAQIQAGVPLIMVNHVAYQALDPELPASMAPETYDLLREMGFAGVAITDSIGMGAVHTSWDFTTAAVMAVRAGADAVLSTDGTKARAMRDALVAAVVAGELAPDRLDDAAARMLALKGEDPEVVVCREMPAMPTMRFGRGGALR